MVWPFRAQYPLVSVEQIGGREYDYIVIGGGTAGCVVASRLSEDPSVSVLLLEKGDVNQGGWLTRIPLTSSVNGSYMVRRPTEPDAGTGHRRQEVFAGETLGGSTRLNGMIYSRGIPGYYNSWSEKSGYADWAWANVEPYFDKVEGHAGRGPGMVQLRQLEPESGVYSYLQRSAEAMGLVAEVHPNRPSAVAAGYYTLDLTIDNHGYRHSAQQAYLGPEVAYRRRQSLHICSRAQAVRLDILPGAAAASATGVIVQSVKPQPPASKVKQVKVKAKATREIILCTGAICTPALLQLSGVGPASLLQQNSVPVRLDLDGVGRHLMDHSAFPVWLDVQPHDTLHPIMDNPLQALKNFLLYCAFGTGWLKTTIDRAIFYNTAHVMTEGGRMRVCGTAATLDGSRPENVPDVEIMMLPVNSKPDLHPGHTSMTFLTILNQPFSTGTVSINSTDPGAHPAIQLGTLSDPRDRATARTALRLSLQLAEHTAVHSGYPHKCSIIGGPGPSSPGGASDQDLDDYIQKYIDCSHHLTSSCRMATADRGGVVDGELRVHGLGNVRIADASVLPGITPAHPMAAVYMVAERCADFVKQTGKATRKL